MDEADFVAGLRRRIAVAGNVVDVGQCDVEREIAALQQQARRDPAAALRPAGHRRRMHQALAERGRGFVEVGHAGHFGEAELAVGGHHQFDRPLDARRDRLGRMEIARHQQHFEEGRDLVIAGLQPPAQFRGQRRIDVLAHEVAVQLRGQKLRRDRLVENDVDHLHAVEIAAPAEHLLGGVIVLRGIDVEGDALEIPAGEGARRLADVMLRVVADAHGEQLHDFAGEILVRGTLHVHAGIQEGQHGRVLRDADQQGAEVAQALILEQLKLVQHLAVVAHLVFIGGEVAVPEQRHLLLQRARRGEHAVCPPVGDAVGFELAGAQPVEKLVHHRLHATVATVLHADTDHLAPVAGGIGGGGPAGGERVQPLLEYAGMIEWRQVGRGRAFEIHQATHRLGGRQAGECVDVVRRAAEAGTFEQMRGARPVPVSRADRGQVAG